MDSITKLSRGYLRYNRAQYLLITLSIILTTCLLTAIGVTSISIQEKLRSDIVGRVGTAHGRYSGINSKQLDILKNNQRLKEVGEQIIAGTVKTQEIKRLNAYLIYEDMNAANMSNKILYEGKFPVKDNEIAAERWALEELGIKARPGEEIRLKFLNLLKGGLKEETFVISGILKDNEFLKTAGQAELMVSGEFASKGVSPGDLNYNAFVKVGDRNDITSTIYEVANNVGIKSVSVGVNTEYLNTLKPDPQIVMSAGLIALIVIIASFIVIYNIFNISIAARINQLGLLSAVGMTKKQLKSLIAREGRLLSILGIPIWLILGYAISYLIAGRVVLENNALSIKANPYIILFSGFLSYFTIRFSLGRPGKIASRITPVEATRYNPVEAYGRKMLRKGFKEISIGGLAYASFLRNKRRTILTILSLTMSGVLFIVFSTILSSMNVDNLVEQHIRTDFQLSLDNQRDNSTSPLNQGLVDEIKALPGVLDVHAIRHTQVYIPNSAGIKQPNNKNVILNELNSDLYGLDSEMLEESRNYLIDGEISISNLKEENQVLMVRDSFSQDPYAVGDKVTLTLRKDGKVSQREFFISGIINKNPWWLGFTGMGPTFITHEETLKRELNVETIKRISLNSDRESYENISSRLSRIASNNKVILESRQEYKQGREDEIRGIKIMIMGLVLIIGLIGIMNLINTMATSILSRKKEIGILQALGMTDKQVIRMLQIEGLYYAVISLVLSITAGSFLGYIFFNAFKKAATYAQYKYPAVTVLLIIAAFITVQVLVTFLVVKALNRSSVVERIRYSE